MKNGLTELVFILDKSGSMQGLEKDTIGGFNSMIESQKKEDGECIVSTVLFNHFSQVIHDRMDIHKIKPLTTNDYQVSGCTALLDSVGDAIHHIGNVHKYARTEDVPEQTIVVITTDGLENASQRYTYKMIKKIIERQKAKYDWEFMFLGANIDVDEVGEHIGMERKECNSFHADSEGVTLCYDIMNTNIIKKRLGKRKK